MDSIDITVGDNFCASTGDVTSTGWKTYTCNPQPVRGSTLTFINQKSTIMYMCGLNIYAEILTIGEKVAFNEIDELMAKDTELEASISDQEEAIADHEGYITTL